MTNLPDKTQDLVGLPFLAEIFGVTERQARNLARDAGVEPVQRGRWHLASTVRGVVAHARASRETHALTAAKARAINARAAMAELAAAERSRATIPVEDAELAMDLMVRAVLDELDALPARLGRGRPELRAELFAEAQSMRARISAALRNVIAQASK